MISHTCSHRYIHKQQHGIELRDNMFVINVGSNIGIFELFLNENVTNFTCLSIEPMLENIKLMKQNLMKNDSNIHWQMIDDIINDNNSIEQNLQKYQKNVIICACVASDFNGNSTLLKYPNVM